MENVNQAPIVVGNASLVVEFVSAEPFSAGNQGPRRNVARFVSVNVNNPDEPRSSHELAPGETLALAFAPDEVVRLEMIEGTVRVRTVDNPDGILFKRLETLTASESKATPSPMFQQPAREPGSTPAPDQSDQALDAWARTVRRLVDRTEQAEQTRDAAQASATATIEANRVLTNVANELRETIREVSADLAASGAEVERLRVLADERVATLHIERDAWRQERGALAVQLAEARQALKDATEGFERHVSGHLKDDQRKIAALLEELDTAKAELAGAEEERDSAIRDRDGWKGKADALEGDRDAWKAKADGLASALVLAQQDQDYWKGTAVLHQDAAAVQAAKVDALAADRDIWKARAAECDDWKAQATTGLATRVQALQAEWEAEATALRGQVSEIVTQMNGWQRRALQAESENALGRHAREELLRRVGELEATVDNLQSQLRRAGAPRVAGPVEIVGQP